MDEPRISTGRTGNQWFTIPEPPGGTVTKPLPEEKRAEVSFTLTDAEREAMWFAIAYAQNAGHPAEATLRGLLDRTK